MKIDRTAYVARTAHDKTHGNRLVVPEYGIVELRLKKSDTVKSISHLAKASIPRRTPTTGGDAKFCFAPGAQWDPVAGTELAAQKDTVKLWYHLYNPFSQITEAKLELFRRFDDTAFWKRDLKDDELLDGEHELEFDPGNGVPKTKDWDGHFGPDTTDYPDGYLTTEHSPYKLRLTVKGDGISKSPIAWTFFHILIHKIELEWGPDEAVTKDAEKRKPFKTLKTDVGDPTGSGKIFLISNLFKIADGEMTNNDLFTLYQTEWGDGPEIAVVAKVSVRDSSGNAVIAPKALGGTKFLWDWESKLKKSKTSFTADAENYSKTKSKPKGLNCHLARGGKRGDDNKQVFPAQGGYDGADVLTDGTFPFAVTAVTKERKWAAYSKAWRKGKLAGKTGVLFQPSRMAGDAYKLTVYAAHEIEDDKRVPRLEVDKDPPLKIAAALKVESGIFQVWRKVHFQSYITKNGASTASTAGIKAFYEKAFVEIEDLSTGVATYPSGEWNTQMSTTRSGWHQTGQFAMDPAVDQHAAGQHGLDFRTYADFKVQVATMDFTTYAGGIDKYLANNGLSDSAAYAAKCEQLALTALTDAFNRKMPAADGVSLFQVNYSINKSLIDKLDSWTDGLAANFAAGGRTKAAFLWTAPSTEYSAKQGTAATPAHEIGHLLMLPHPRGAGENEKANKKNDYNAHDRSVKNCLMSYLEGTREICGFCQLRLRGWDKSALKPGGKNSK